LLSKTIKIRIYRTVILLVVLNGCKSWSITLREECRLRVFKNRMLKKIFRPTNGEVMGDYERLRNKELCALYTSPNIIWVIKSRTMRDNLEDLCRDGRIILKWIFTRNGMGRHGLDCTGSGHRLVVGACDCSNEPSGSIKCGEFFDFSGRTELYGVSSYKANYVHKCG
jgi:hypothetical protein